MSKRKQAPTRRPAAKRGKKKEESDIDSDLSDQSENENGPQPDEVLISGHGDALDELTKLPDELLKTLIKPAGQLLIFGQVNWDLTGRKDSKTSKLAFPNLYTPHRFTNLRVIFCGHIYIVYLIFLQLNRRSVLLQVVVYQLTV